MLQKEKKAPRRRSAAKAAAPGRRPASAAARPAAGASRPPAPRAPDPATVAAVTVKRGTDAPAPTAVSARERARMIAEAAYFRAQRRGFRNGDPARDWAEAEAEIDAMLLHRR